MQKTQWFHRWSQTSKIENFAAIQALFISNTFISQAEIGKKTKQMLSNIKN